MRQVILHALIGLMMTGLVFASDGGVDHEILPKESTVVDFRFGENIDWQVISTGGNNSGESTNYRLAGTAGQTAVGKGIAAGSNINHGFWQDFSSGADCVAGDANGSGAVDIDDVVYEITYIFGGGPPPIPELCCGDANGSGAVDIDDVVYLIAYIFGGGSAPVDIC